MNEQIERIIKHELAIPVAVGVVSAGVGIAVGYVLGFRRGVEHTYDAMVDVFEEEAEQRSVEAEVTVEEPPRVVIDADDLDTLRERWESENISVAEQLISERTLNPEEVRQAQEEIELAHSAAVERTYPQALLDAAAQAGVTPQQMDEDMKRVERALERDSIRLGELLEDPPEPAVEANIFANTGDGWDYEQELRDREGKSIYIIHADEYNAAEEGYTQITLTYYAGDDLMADDKDEMVRNHDRTVGELRFGHGSNDPNVCYIRNDVREADYEVLLHTGHYTQEVMGLAIESERATTRIQRMRQDTDT